MTEARWMIRDDLDAVLAIERAEFACPWSRKDFIATLRDKATTGLVVVDGEQVVGYLIYRRRHDCLAIMNIAIAEPYQRRGIGRALLRGLKKLLWGMRRYIRAVVGERNLAAQLWLARQGFLAVRIGPAFDDEAAIWFEFDSGCPEWRNCDTAASNTA